MASESRSLNISIDQRAVGTLFEQHGLWFFQYDTAWIKDPQAFALSPNLPLQAAPLVDGASRRHVQWYFDNLLPEEGQRLLLASDARLSSTDAFGLLEYYGSESAGSLTLLPPDTQVTDNQERRLLTDDELSSRIADLPRLPLTHGAAKRMSLAGAQHKLAVILDQDTLYEPLGATPSTHILKPDHDRRDFYPHSAINEWFVMLLAEKAGLAVPTVYRRYVPEAIYLVERFDRKQRAVFQRLHVIDACQLTGLDRSFKYAAGSLEKLTEIISHCRGSAGARTRLYTWLIFNVLVGNNDAHLKNLSFMVSDAGIELAPHYDLLSTTVYESLAYGGKQWPESSTLAWPILGRSRFAEIDRTVLLEAGLALGLRPATAKRLLDQLLSSIAEKTRMLYEEVQAQNQALVTERPTLGTTLAGEERCLRAIIHNVILPMASQLR